MVDLMKGKISEYRTMNYGHPQFIRYNGIYDDKTVVRYDWMDLNKQYNPFEDIAIKQLSSSKYDSSYLSTVKSYISIGLTAKPYDAIIFCDSDKIRFNVPQSVKETIEILPKYGNPPTVVNIPTDSSKPLYNDWSFYKDATVVQTDTTNLARVVNRSIDKDDDRDIIGAGLAAKQKFNLNQLLITKYNDVRSLFLIDKENEVVNITNNRIDQSRMVDRFNCQYMITSLLAFVLITGTDIGEGLEFISKALEVNINIDRPYPILYPLSQDNMRTVPIQVSNL
jgi:hypothetical protein